MKIRALRSRSRRAVGLAAVVLTLGLAGGAAATAGLALAADDAGAAELTLREASVRSALGSALQRYADTMHDVSAVAGSDALPDTVTRIAGERLPGAHQVLVVAADGTVLARHAADGSTPATAAALSPAPELSRAMALATQHGGPVAGAAHVLPADAGLPAAQRQQAFELVAPLRDPAGWVIVSVRATDFLDAALRAAGVTGVSVTLTDRAEGVATWSQGGPASGDESRLVDLPMNGNSWQARVRPTTPLVSAAVAAAAPVTMVGATLAGLALAALVLFLSPVTTPATITRTREIDNELAGFAATATEHLHTPLHTIAGFTEILLEDAPGLDEESRGFVRRIDSATRRMLTIVDELVTYASAADAALKPEPIEASLLALDVAASHLPGPSIEIGELPAVSGDAALLRQVLDQLITNALRFVRHGAPALVEVTASPRDDGWWRIQVADRGIGVPEEQRSRIFAPFHRTPAAEGYPGTGLGLAVCARIVALHGGEIGVETNPGGGSVFWFTVAGAALGAREPAGAL
ncbi:sensor histidine kinase [Paractinoplanes globisporus]|uniref:Sensor-like histidine kinase SenX3 n=1 Tax=Paractinoplanes globisporus TaxID=113565 RepID=A0ABW6WFL9_9ACTN|nr:HAMP domain-containing sensor histidine kinase [Actinoplanes globisporus]